MSYNDFWPQLPMPISIPEPVTANSLLHEQFNILRHYVQDFEQTLDSQHEVGIMMTNFGQSIIMQVEEITYEEPVTFVFKGQVNCKSATLIQHMNQLNFLLTSLDKVDERPKNPIGFRVPSE